MTRITEELLRKRSEHNDGCLSSLKEIALHQFDIEKLEVVGDLCRELQILLLQNNLISKIENLHHLKDLRYLNLALNNITWIENLGANEMLEKLDLTCNFIKDPLCLENLRGNYRLRELFLTGNPCTQLDGYRLFAIATLPQLWSLDMHEITRTERILAMQQHLALKAKFVELAKAEGTFCEREIGQHLLDENGEQVYGWSPEERMRAYRNMEEARNKAKEENSKKGSERTLKPPKREILSAEEELEKYGRIFQHNQGRWGYKMNETNTEVVLDVPAGRYLDTSLIDVDLQPSYVRITIKGKVLQLLLPAEVNPDKAIAQRSTTTGHLKLIMPKAQDVLGRQDDTGQDEE